LTKNCRCVTRVGSVIDLREMRAVETLIGGTVAVEAGC